MTGSSPGGAGPRITTGSDLWPAYRPYMEGHETGEIRRYRICPDVLARQQREPITIYMGDGDAVIELAEDEKSTQELADSFAELAGMCWWTTGTRATRATRRPQHE